MAFKRMIHAVDTHAGTPMRVITGGVPHIPGSSVYEKMKWLAANDDQLRKLMLCWIMPTRLRKGSPSATLGRE